MPPSVSRLLELQHRRGQMVLTMAKDASRAKAKLREARHKKARQIGYRSVRYRRFQGRRGDVLEEEGHQVIRARREKSFQAMKRWLKLQTQANAEEGTPREEFVEPEDEPLGRLVATPSVERVGAGQCLMTSFLTAV